MIYENRGSERLSIPLCEVATFVKAYLDVLKNKSQFFFGFSSRELYVLWLFVL